MSNAESAGRTVLPAPHEPAARPEPAAHVPYDRQPPGTPEFRAQNPRREIPDISPDRRNVNIGLRFLRNELRTLFFRRRNQLLLLAVGLFPLLIGIGLKAASPHPRDGGSGGGGGPVSAAAYFNQLAGNGVFLTFIALTLLLVLVLPVAVGIISGDSVAGEAGYGTLRYLLAVPAGRTRLLAVKYAAIVAWALSCVFVVSAVALAVGAGLFGIGPVTLLSGTTISIGDGLFRVLLITLYIAAAMAAVGALGLAVSTFTEHAIGAIAAVMVLIVASEVVDQIPQFAAVAPYLPTHWWTSFDAFLRSPMDTTTIAHGLLSFAVYIVLLCSVAWARFTSQDVTS